MWSRKALGAAAKEIADHLQLVDHVKTLQTVQSELSDSLSVLSDRVRALEAEIKVLKAETKLDALKEAQAVVYAVQNGLNQRIEDLAVKIAIRDAADRFPKLPPGYGDSSR